MEMAFSAVGECPRGMWLWWKSCPVPTLRVPRSRRRARTFGEAVELVIEANRALAREELGTAQVVREPLKTAG